MARTVADAMNDLWKKGIKPVDDTKAPLNSPALTGTPTAPTPEITDNSDRIATTAHVLTMINNLIGSAPGVLDTLGEIAAALKNNPDIITTLQEAITNKMDAKPAGITLSFDGTDFGSLVGVTSGGEKGVGLTATGSDGTVSSVNLYGGQAFVQARKDIEIRSFTGKVLIAGTELYFNGTRLA